MLPLFSSIARQFPWPGPSPLLLELGILVHSKLWNHGKLLWYGAEAIATRSSPLIDPCYVLHVWQMLQRHSSLYKLVSLELQGAFFQHKYHKIAYTRYNCLVQKNQFATKYIYRILGYFWVVIFLWNCFFVDFANKYFRDIDHPHRPRPMIYYYYYWLRLHIILHVAV